MDIRKLTPRSRLDSFRYATKGLVAMFRAEPNAWIHLTASVVVVAGACWFNFAPIEWILIVFAIGMVIAAEAINSSIETLCDYACIERDALIGRAKDLAAAGVLISAITAAIIGLILFVPKIITLF